MENIIVIGGGLMGSAAAWELSKYGEKVLLLEQQDEIYTTGSSFGESRITRSLGIKKDIFSFIQQTTIRETKILLDFLNGSERPKKHKMSDIYTTSPVTYIYDKKEQREVDKLNFKGQKDKFKTASGDLAFNEFGILSADNQIIVQEYKKYSGMMNPRILIQKMQLAIQKKGNEIRYNQQIINLIKKENYYKVILINTKTNEKQILKTRKIIFAAGGYNGSLLTEIAPYFQALVTPKKILLSFYKIDENRYKSYTNAQQKNILNGQPVFDQNDEMFFSMIDKIDANGVPTFKVGGHALYGNIKDLDTVWTEKPKKEALKWSKNALLNYLQLFQIPIKKKDLILENCYYCVYSVAHNKIPYVTNILTADDSIDANAVVIGGMSGIGAKGCLAYGLFAADLLLNKSEANSMYKKTKKTLGVERLQKEIFHLKK
jgi:glycine/D-amino acid oxidase-like deaminating enzyme